MLRVLGKSPIMGEAGSGFAGSLWHLTNVDKRASRYRRFAESLYTSHALGAGFVEPSVQDEGEAVL